MSLHDKKYIIIRKIISKELAKVYYDYMINKEKTCYTLINNGQIKAFNTDFGCFNCPQVENSYSLYGDQLFDNMMIHLKPRIEKETGLELAEMYSYARNYRQTNYIDTGKITNISRTDSEDNLTRTVVVTWRDEDANTEWLEDSTCTAYRAARDTYESDNSFTRVKPSI